MYFVLSKLLLVFIMPLTWVVVLLVAGLIVKRPKLKRRLLLAGTVVVLLFTNSLLLTWFSHCWDIPVQPLPAGKVYSAGIVLGGYANEDGRGGGYFSSSANRFIQAVKLRNTGRVSRLMITGGNAGLNPTAFREGAWVKGQLKYFGVADSTALVDPDSRNTIENAINSRRVLDSAGLKPPYLLITSSYHMRRSLYIFKQAGIQVVPYVCDYDADSEPSFDDLIPEASVLPKWNLYIKEVVGLGVTYFKKIPSR